MWSDFPRNLCTSARIGGQVLTLEGQTCSLGRTFTNWRFFGENGLAGEEVSVWVYENTLKVEHQATTLSLYSVRLSSDQREITEVKNGRRLETHFRSPQMDLWQISDTEWLLALRRPEPAAPRKKPGKIVSLAEQLMLPEFGATG